MPSERSLANLKPFERGVSGNPGGRPRKILTDRYRALMESALPREISTAMKLPANSTWGDAVAHVSARTALKATEVGVSQRKELADRLEGKARVEFLSDEQIDIRVSFEDLLGTRKHPELIDIGPESTDVTEGLADPGEAEKE